MNSEVGMRKSEKGQMTRIRSPSYAAASRGQTVEVGSGKLEVGSRNAEFGIKTEDG